MKDSELIKEKIKPINVEEEQKIEILESYEQFLENQSFCQVIKIYIF